MPLPVVYVHGIRLNSSCWVEQRRLLADHSIACPDLPGHGTRRGRERFTIDGAVEVVAETLDSVGPAVLVGHSLGGYVAMATAARRPDSVHALIVAGATLRPNLFLRAAFRLAGAALMSAPHGEKLSATALRRVLPAEIAEPVIAAGIASEVIPDVMDAARQIDPIADLRRYREPTILANGRRDHFRLGENRFQSAAGSVHLLPGGHYAPMVHGAAFADLVLSAAAGHPASPVSECRRSAVRSDR